MWDTGLLFLVSLFRLLLDILEEYTGLSYIIRLFLSFSLGHHFFHRELLVTFNLLVFSILSLFLIPGFLDHHAEGLMVG